jgi:hypothetical protein
MQIGKPCRDYSGFGLNHSLSGIPIHSVLYRQLHAVVDTHVLVVRLHPPLRAPMHARLFVQSADPLRRMLLGAH